MCCKRGQLETSFKRVSKKTDAYFWLAAFGTVHLCGREVCHLDTKNVCLRYREKNGVHSLLGNKTLNISSTFSVSSEREHKNCGTLNIPQKPLEQNSFDNLTGNCLRFLNHSNFTLNTHLHKGPKLSHCLNPASCILKSVCIISTLTTALLHQFKPSIFLPEKW